MVNPVTFRPATSADIPLGFPFIKLLAEYEKLSDAMRRRPSKHCCMNGYLKRKQPRLFCRGHHKAVGFALFFYNFSTFSGRAGLCLEDLYVKEAHRGKGYGKAVFRKLAGLAIQRGCGRLGWQCPDWNKTGHRLLSFAQRPPDG